MTKAEIAAQALSNAQNGASLSNYPAIFAGFAEKGIAESDIIPRVNVLTFHAWRALGRTVRKGEHGVKVCTYVPMSKTEPATEQQEGDAKQPGQRRTFRRPKTTTVFHISQTEPLQ